MTRIFWNVNNDDGEIPPLEGADPSAIVRGELRVTIGRRMKKTTFAQAPADNSTEPSTRASAE